MGKSQEGKQERNRRKQSGNAEEDRNLKRDRDLEKEKVESLYVTREMAEDKEMDEKIRQDLIHAADQAEKEFQKEEALGAPRMRRAEKERHLGRKPGRSAVRRRQGSSAPRPRTPQQPQKETVCRYS